MLKLTEVHPGFPAVLVVCNCEKVTKPIADHWDKRCGTYIVDWWLGDRLPKRKHNAVIAEVRKPIAVAQCLRCFDATLGQYTCRQAVHMVKAPIYIQVQETTAETIYYRYLGAYVILYRHPPPTSRLGNFFDAKLIRRRTWFSLEAVGSDSHLLLFRFICPSIPSRSW